MYVHVYICIYHRVGWQCDFLHMPVKSNKCFPMPLPHSSCHVHVVNYGDAWSKAFFNVVAQKTLCHGIARLFWSTNQHGRQHPQHSEDSAEETAVKQRAQVVGNSVEVAVEHILSVAGVAISSANQQRDSTCDLK